LAYQVFGKLIGESRGRVLSAKQKRITEPPALCRPYSRFDSIPSRVWIQSRAEAAEKDGYIDEVGIVLFNEPSRWACLCYAICL
jgi:hypothetical protein